MENFCHNIAQVLKDDTSDEQLFLKTGFNVFIIGFKQSGKSTLANVLSDQKQLYFSKEGSLFQPINKNYFPIIDENCTGTQQQKSIIFQDFQIWDFPGYGMGEDAMRQIETRIQQIVLINKSSATHIVIVLPYSQFSQDRGQNLIQISNLIAQKDLRASIIISKVPPKVKLQTLVDKIQSQLNQEENIYTEEAKTFLNLIIQNNQIQLLYFPQLNENYYTFHLNHIQQLKQLVFNKKYFLQVQIKFRFIPSDKIKVDEFISQLQNNLKETENKMIKSQIKINVQLIQPQHQDEEQQCVREYSINKKQQKYYLDQYKQLQQIFGLKEWNQQQSDKQINQIDDFFNQKHVQITNNQLHVNCAKYDLLELQKIYSQNKNVQEIYIYSLHEFYVNSNIEIPGVQIYIKCKNFRVEKKYVINLKGQKGQPFMEKARNGDDHNIHGDVGQVGNQGQSGGTIYVDAEKYHNLQLLTIDISGGDGGKGQDGGDGCDGTKGVDGYEEEVKRKKEKNEMEKWEEVPTNLLEDVFPGHRVILYEYRSKGQAGRAGGNAGGGGRGGLCGDVGIINFENLNGKQILYINNNSKQGNEGNDGLPGKGGLFGTDYVGSFQDVLRQPRLIKQVNQDKQEQYKLNGQQELLQIEQNDVVFEAKVKQGLRAFSTIGAFAILGLKIIASKDDLIIRQGWNYIKLDVESTQRSDSGSINREISNKMKQSIIHNYNNIGFQERLNYFKQFQKEKFNQIKDQFKQLRLSEEQISQIFGE